MQHSISRRRVGAKAVFALSRDVCLLQVARLGIALKASASGIQVELPDWYAPFEVGEAYDDTLSLCVREGPLPSSNGWQSLYCGTNTWQLWRDGDGRDVYVCPAVDQPTRQITVDSAYREGEIVYKTGDVARSVHTLYPLQDIDIKIYANWLARYGDLIMHACGIDDAGAGYVCVGPSGAGKSTLASALVSDSQITVLGEDNVIVRYLEGRFLLYGTPWHTNPARCAPGGVPLQKLFLLDRKAEPGVRSVTRLEGIQRVLQDSFIPYYNHTGVGRILDTLGHLAEHVPFYSLSYSLGSDVLRLIREA